MAFTPLKLFCSVQVRANENNKKKKRLTLISNKFTHVLISDGYLVSESLLFPDLFGTDHKSIPKIRRPVRNTSSEIKCIRQI